MMENLKNLFPNAVKKPRTTQQALGKVMTARLSLLAAVVLTLINIILYVFDLGPILFSILASYYVFNPSLLGSIFFSLILLLVYFAFFWYSGKRPKFLIAALVFFAIDTILLFVLSIPLIIQEESMSFSYFLFDYLGHLWVLYCLIGGVSYVGLYQQALDLEEQQEAARLEAERPEEEASEAEYSETEASEEPGDHEPDEQELQTAEIEENSSEYPETEDIFFENAVSNELSETEEILEYAAEKVHEAPHTETITNAEE